MKALGQPRQRKGFTLMEMLIVVAIIAILVAIAIPIFSSQLEKAKVATDEANCRSAKSACMTYAMAEYGGSLSGKTAGEWSDYAVSQGIPKNGQADPSKTLTATVGASSIEFTYGDGGGLSHTPFSKSDVPSLASDIASALSKLLASSSGKAILSTSTYNGTSYVYTDMSFSGQYAELAGSNISKYLADAGLSASQLAAVKSAQVYVMFDGPSSSPTSVRGYCYVDPDDSTKVVVVSSNGTTKTVDKISTQTRGYVGYYSSLM